MVPRLVRMGLALLLAGGVYLLLLEPSTSWEFMGAAPSLAPEQPVEGPGLSVAAADGQPQKPETVVLPRSETITGVVRDEAGKPAPKIRVELVHVSPHVDLMDVKSALGWRKDFVRRTAELIRAPAPQPVESFVETDDQGHFELTTKDWGFYRVRAMPEPPRFGTHHTVRVAHRAPKPIELRVGPGSTLSGRVLDMTDKPVGAFLVLSSTKLAHGWWKSQPLANDSKDGSFAFEGVPPGEYALACIVPGVLRLKNLAVTLPREEPLVVRVPAGGASLVGTIEGPEGEAVAGADVLAIVPIPDGSTIESVARSAADGSYAAANLPAGKLTRLTVSATGYLDHVGTLPLAPWAGAQIPDKGSERVDIKLLKGAAVFGTVQLAGGKPLSGVTVMVVPSRWRPPGLGAASPMVTETNAEGAYRIEGIPIGKHVLFAHHEELYMPAIEAIANRAGPPPELLVLVDEAAADVERNLLMAKGIAIAGKVIDQDEEPVAGAAIRTKSGIQSRWWSAWGVSASLPGLSELARTESDGSFSIESLPPRTDWILAAKSDGRLGIWSEPLSNEKARTDVVTLRMELGVAVRGTVIDDNGPVPLANVSIWIRNSKSLTGSLYAKTKDDGTFEILGVPTGGDGGVNANDGSGRGGYMQLKGLEPGEDREDIEIKLRENKGVEVAGVLLDEDGKPLARYRIQAKGSGPDPYGTTDSQGRFSFERGPTGLIRFRVQQPGGSWTYIKEKFRSPADDLELTFTPRKQRVIEGRVLGPDGRPVPIVRVHVAVGKPPKPKQLRNNRNLGQEVVGGVFKTSVLGEGPIWIRAHGALDVNGRPMNARGVTKTYEEDEISGPVEIKLEEGLTIKGVVKGPEEEPIDGALVQSGRFMARTQSDGRFVMRGLDEGSVQLYVQPPIEYSAPPQTKAEAGAEDIEISVLKAAVLRGRVTDADGAGVTVGRASVRWKNPTDGKNQSRSAQLDGEGHFVVKGIPAGTRVTVEARLWGRNNNGRVVEPKKDVDPNAGVLILVAERGAAISGYVMDSQRNPVYRVYITATRVDGGGSRRSGSARTNRSGEFRIQGLNEGEYSLTVRPQNSMLSMPPLMVSAPADNVGIRLPESTEIRGRLNDPEGTRGWTLQLVQPDTNRTTRIGLKSDGTWVAPRVSYNETYTLRAYNINANLYALEENVRAGAKNLVLEPQDGLAISGRVELASGAPTKGYVYAQGPGWSISRTSDEGGNFSIGPFPPGRFSMWVYQQNVWNNRVHVQDVDAGTNSLIVQLPK